MSLLVHDRSARCRMTFSGDQAKAALGGLVSNDVVALTPGRGQRAAALTAKGRIIALCRVFDRGTDLLVDCDAASGEGFTSMIRKYVNPRLAKHADVSAATGCIGVHGEGAAAAVAAALVTSLPEVLAPLACHRVGEGEEAAWVIRSDDLAIDGFDIIASRARVDAIRSALLGQGARVASPDELLALRIARGIPEFGVEMDAETLPQEAMLDALGAIAFDKGCYTGQEVVARIHFRGHVNRHLRWLSSATPLHAGARVFDASGVEVGDVRSATGSSLRGPLAIAMVRREVEPGSTVIVREAAGETNARVEMLPA